MTHNTTPTLTIGELAERTGLTRRALRLYEQVGLITPQRGPNNYRLYSDADALQARVIHELREGGLSLEAIGALFAIKHSDQPPNERAKAARHVLQAMQRTLEQRRTRIDQALAYVAEQLNDLDQFLEDES